LTCDAKLVPKGIQSIAVEKSAVSFFTGPVSTFEEIGFVEVKRRAPTRPIMRYFLK